MATFSRIKTWVSNEVLTAADLNAEFNNIINNITPTGIEDASANVAAMQASVDPGGVGTESLATDLLGEIQRLRYVIKRIVGSAGQWYSTPAIDLSTTIGTTKLTDSGVTTAKIQDAAVTPIKRSENKAVSANQYGYSLTTIGAPTDVPNLSASITTAGKPVEVLLSTTDIATNYSYFGARCVMAGTGGNFAIFAALEILRDGTTVYSTSIPATGYSGAATDMQFMVPSGALRFIDDAPAAGAHTYKLRATVSTSVLPAGATPSFYIQNVKLYLREL